MTSINSAIQYFTRDEVVLAEVNKLNMRLLNRGVRNITLTAESVAECSRERNISPVLFKIPSYLHAKAPVRNLVLEEVRRSISNIRRWENTPTSPSDYPLPVSPIKRQVQRRATGTSSWPIQATLHPDPFPSLDVAEEDVVFSGEAADPDLESTPTVFVNGSEATGANLEFTSTTSEATTAELELELTSTINSTEATTAELELELTSTINSTEAADAESELTTTVVSKKKKQKR